MWSCILTGFLFFIALIVTYHLGVKLYHLITIVYCPSKADMFGKTVIITGANSGIGKMTALGLAKRNAKVILACRNVEKGKEAKDEIISITGNINVFVKYLDLSSFKSVRQFAQEIILEENRLDVLINNAGIITTEKRITENHLESIMQVNHFGHFLLTNLLLDLLKKSSPSRIVVVSSRAHRWGTIDFDNLNAEKFFTFAFYFNSKLANVLFTRELSRILEGSGVTVNCLHPGSVSTNIVKGFPWPINIIFSKSLELAGRSTWQAAQTSIYLAVGEEFNTITGCYYSYCKKASLAKIAEDNVLARKLWEVSEKLTGWK